MTKPIQIRGDWWYEQADGSWLRWDESRGTWLAQSLPPPPPLEAPPTPDATQTPSPQAQPFGSQVQTQAPSQPEAATGHLQTHGPAGADRPPPASDYPQVMTRSYDPAPAMGPTGGVITPAADGGERLPADQLIVSESYVVSTQQTGGVAIPSGAAGSVIVEQVAPNVTRVTTETAVETSVPPAPEQVRAMSLTKLSESERAATQQRLAVLGSCLAVGERLVGLTFGPICMEPWRMGLGGVLQCASLSQTQDGV